LELSKFCHSHQVAYDELNTWNQITVHNLGGGPPGK
jgi:hypothetical protein